MPEKYRSSEEGVLQFIHDYSEVAKILKDHGMTFHYHNHSFEFEKSGDKTWFDIMIEESDPELFYFILDTFWVQHGGCSPEDYVKRLGKRIKILHLKDFAIQSWKQKFAPIGSGNLNWDAILSNAAEAGIPYAMVEQDSDFADDPISELERSYRFLSAKGFH